MKEPLIPGGYIFLSRKIIESEIWQKPPLYIKVWVYLLSKAQHKDYKNLKRGQLWTSIPEIQEACSWYVGFRKETPSKDQIYRIIDWLRKSYEQADEEGTTTSMITTTKATQGMLINIVNYDIYQSSENYERNAEQSNEKEMNATRTQRDANNINKNDKKEKNEKNDKELYISIVEYLNSKTNKNFKSTSKATQNIINARINEGFTIDDFKKVIDHKTTSWINDVKMSEYLRPQTLFGTKFESYLNEGGIKGGELKGNNGTNINKRTASEESLRLERIAKETGLLDENGRCKPIGEIPF